MNWQSTIIDPILEAVQLVLDLAPRLLASITVMLIGVVFAYLVKRLVIFILRIANFDVLSYRIGLTSIISKAWYDQTPAYIFGRIAYWLILFVHLLLAVSVLHIESLNRMASAVVFYIPLTVIAVVILLAGYVISRFVGRAVLITMVNWQYGSANLIAFLIRTIIMVFFAAIAVEYLGVGRGIIVTTFAIILGGIVLALSIAFGLGGKDIAKEILEKKLKSIERKEKTTDDISHI